MNITIPAVVLSCRKMSNTFTGKLHVAVFPEASVAVQLTVVVPSGKLVPDGGTHTTAPAGSAQLSAAVTVYVTSVPTFVVGQVGGDDLTTSVGQFNTGACVSLTVTVNVQLGPVVVVQLTVVVPIAKVEPAGGVQVTVPQLPVVVGAA